MNKPEVPKNGNQEAKKLTNGESKLSKKELLLAVDDIFHGYPDAHHINEQQAYAQLKEIVKWYFVESIEEIVAEFYPARPRVTREWIYELAQCESMEEMAKMLIEAGMEVEDE